MTMVPLRNTISTSFTTLPDTEGDSKINYLPLFIQLPHTTLVSKSNFV